MRIEKSAFEKKIRCNCGCVFYANKRDFRDDGFGLEFVVRCPQCGGIHSINLDEYCTLFDATRYRYGEVTVGEVRKTTANGK